MLAPFDYVVPRCLHKIVDTLRVSLIQDRLRADELINREEYNRLSALPIEEDRARLLLNEILPKKGPEAYGKFRAILLSVVGQEHIVRDILDPMESRPQIAEAPWPVAAASRARSSRSSRSNCRDEDEAPQHQSCTAAPPAKKRTISSSVNTGLSSSDDTSSSYSDDEDLIHPHLDKHVTLQHVNAVKKWGNERWRQIGRALKFSDTDLADIASQFNHDGDKEKLHQVIHKWILKYGKKATLRTLLKACRNPEVGIKGKVIDEINGYEKRRQTKKQQKRHESNV